MLVRCTAQSAYHGSVPWMFLTREFHSFSKYDDQTGTYFHKQLATSQRKLWEKPVIKTHRPLKQNHCLFKLILFEQLLQVGSVNCSVVLVNQK